MFLNFKSSTPSHVSSACDILGVVNENYVSVELDQVEGRIQLSVWDEARHSKHCFLKLRVGTCMWDHLGELFEREDSKPAQDGDFEGLKASTNHE